MFYRELWIMGSQQMEVFKVVSRHRAEGHWYSMVFFLNSFMSQDHSVFFFFLFLFFLHLLHLNRASNLAPSWNWRISQCSTVDYWVWLADTSIDAYAAYTLINYTVNKVLLKSRHLCECTVRIWGHSTGLVAAVVIPPPDGQWWKCIDDKSEIKYILAHFSASTVLLLLLFF